MDQVITIPVQVAKIETRADRSMKITSITTAEVDPLEATILFSLANKLGYMGFSERPVKEEDFEGLPEIDPVKGEKTPSKRLRDRMLVYYKKKHGNTDRFESWYTDQLNMVGERYLDKIE